MTVSPASAMAKTRIRVALDSNTQRLGGKAHGAEHARPVSVGVGNGTNSSGNGTKNPLPLHPGVQFASGCPALLAYLLLGQLVALCCIMMAACPANGFVLL